MELTEDTNVYTGYTVQMAFKVHNSFKNYSSVCGSFRPAAAMILNCKELTDYTSSIRLFERKIKYLQHRFRMR